MTATMTITELPLPLVEGNVVRGYQIEDGALTTAPVWEDHKRGKNWAAVIVADPKSPGGLGHAFLPRANGRYMYQIGGLKVGQAIEFAGDYVGGSGRPTPNRWHGVIRAVEPDRLVCEKCATSAQAITLARAMVGAEQAPILPAIAITFTGQQLQDLRDSLTALEMWIDTTDPTPERAAVGRAKIASVRAALPGE